MSGSTKKFIGAAAIAAALTGGGVAGALLGSPITSGAQSETSTTVANSPDGAVDTPPFAGDRFGHHGGAALDAAASALDLTSAELRTELEAGKTIAEVAEAAGVDVAEVIDAMIAAATEEIDADAAARKRDLETRITDLVNSGGPFDGPHDRGGFGPGGFNHGGFGHGPGFGAKLDAAAGALGLTEDELRAQIDEGTTLADIAEAEGVDVQKVIDAMVADANAGIDDAVESGDLTAAEGAERKADVKSMITDLVNNGRPSHRPGG